MEVKKFKNYITENCGCVNEKKEVERCEECGKKVKKCKCESSKKSMVSEKMSTEEFLEMIGKGKGKKGKKGKKEKKSCDKSCKK